MKIRNGFISNSSSSSFIIFGENNFRIPKLHKAYNNNIILIPQTFGGTTDFRSNNEYKDFADKLNFAALCAWAKESPSGYDNEETPWTNMLYEVIIEEFHVSDFYINYMNDESSPIWEGPMHQHVEYDSGIIDGGACLFESKEDLKRFLFAPDSYVEINHD